MHLKVQTTRGLPRGLPAALGALFLALLLTGCGRADSEPEPDSDLDPGEAPVSVDSRFGDAYEVMFGRTPADPDVPPAIAGDTLVAQVGYAGGCEDHAFALDAETVRDTVRLWLRHDANGDACEAYLHDEVRLAVPRAARGEAPVVLLNPHGGPPFVVGRMEAE